MHSSPGLKKTICQHLYYSSHRKDTTNDCTDGGEYIGPWLPLHLLPHHERTKIVNKEDAWQSSELRILHLHIPGGVCHCILMGPHLCTIIVTAIVHCLYNAIQRPLIA